MKNRHTFSLFVAIAALAALALVGLSGALGGTGGRWASPDRIARAQTDPTPTPGVSFGPIIGPEYTPQPLRTPLPQVVRERPCPALVMADAGVSLYSAADAASAVVGSARAREQLTVVALANDAAGNSWAQTERGWLPLMLNGVLYAQLDSMRACEILKGTTPNTTLVGLHLLNGTSSEEVLALVQRMVDAGTPIGTVKGLNGAEQLLTQIKQISPQTVTVFRSLLTSEGMRDCPAEPGQYGDDPEGTARSWMRSVGGYWDMVEADYYEVVNECPVDLEWLSRFSIEAMKIAAEQGRCLLLFSFPGGNPTVSDFLKVLPAYEYAVQNPCAEGRTHGIALHAYSTQDGVLVSESDKWVALRHRIFEEELRQRLPEAVDLPVYITELGQGGGMAIPSCEGLIRDALQYAYQLEEDPYVKGFHLWSVGTGTGWVDITPCLPALGDALVAYYGGS